MRSQGEASAVSRTGEILGPRLRLALLVLLVAGLAVQGARLAMIFTATSPAAAPIPVSQHRSPGADPALLARLNPFGGELREAAAQGAAPEAPTLTLYGVRTGGPGASAIIGANGQSQHSYRVGETVAPGLVLSAVAADHITLSRDGGALRLDLARGRPSPAVPTRVQPSMTPVALRTSSAGVADPARLLGEMGLRPRADAGQGAGYAISSAGGALLGQIGLADGDVVTAVDGEPLTPALYAQLPQRLAARSVRLTVERGGAARTVTVQPVRP